MNRILMNDLSTQHRWMQPALDQIWNETLEDSTFIAGPAVSKLETELSDWLQIPYTISCGNGTDALMMALSVLNIPKGASILVPDFSYIAATEAIVANGFIPVFLPVNPNTFLIDPETISRFIDSKTKAIVLVHLFGQAHQMIEICKIASQHGLIVIEDNAQSLGSKINTGANSSKFSGSYGTLSTTSFFPSKVLGALGDGGAIFTHDRKIYEQLRAISNHGQITKYHHQTIGRNSRLDTLQAKILSLKLQYFEDFLFKREAVAHAYFKSFSKIDSIQLPELVTHSTHVWHQFVIKLQPKIRDNFRTYLQEKGIPTMVYYPKLSSEQEAYRDYKNTYEGYKEQSDLCSSVCALPIHAALDKLQIEYICETITNFFKP